MIIDLMSNKTYSEHEIRYIAQDEIASKWNRAAEANIQRKLQGLALNLYVPTTEEIAEIEQYKNDLTSIQSEAAQAAIDNQLLIDTIAYEKALQRIAQYRLAEGKPEQTIYEDDGVTVSAIIQAVDPIPLLIESYDDTGNAINIPNPVIIADNTERLAAQDIVENVSQDVLNLAKKRAI